MEACRQSLIFFFLGSNEKTNLSSHLKCRARNSRKYLHVVPAFRIWFKPIFFSCCTRIKRQTLKSGIVSGLILFTCIKSCFFKHSGQLLYFKILTSVIPWPLQVVSMLSISHACNCCCQLSPSSRTGYKQWPRTLAFAIATPTTDIGGSSLQWLCNPVYLGCSSHLLFLLQNGTGLLQLRQKVLMASTGLSEACNRLWIPNHTCPPPHSY